MNRNNSMLYNRMKELKNTVWPDRDTGITLLMASVPDAMDSFSNTHKNFSKNNAVHAICGFMSFDTDTRRIKYQEEMQSYSNNLMNAIHDVINSMQELMNIINNARRDDRTGIYVAAFCLGIEGQSNLNARNKACELLDKVLVMEEKGIIVTNDLAIWMGLAYLNDYENWCKNDQAMTRIDLRKGDRNNKDQARTRIDLRKEGDRSNNNGGNNNGNNNRDNQPSGGSPQKYLYIIIAILIAVILVVVAMHFKSKSEDYSDDYTMEDEYYTEEYEGDDAAYDENAYVGYESDFVFPESNIRYLEEYEVEYLDIDETQQAINEIYARHGRIFQDEPYHSYFDSCSWYHPLYSPDEFDDSWFNDFEYDNIQLLARHRQQLNEE